MRPARSPRQIREYQRRNKAGGCSCVGVAFGSYANAVALYPPPCLGITRWPVTVDRCIALEVIDLWNQGIVTTGNCCGHNLQPGYIGVDERHVQQMLDMGYEAHGDRPDHFYPKSVGGNQRAPIDAATRARTAEVERIVNDEARIRWWQFRKRYWLRRLERKANSIRDDFLAIRTALGREPSLINDVEDRA